MENDKKGSVFGSILVIVILVGLVVLYLSKKDRDVEQTNETSEMTTEESMQTESMNETSTQTTETEFEAEVESLDTEFSDMNSEDLDM
ncbi:MAG: hypothetical protein R3B55_00935 [Candidatus Paceibacterota bacterium]